MMIVRRHGPYVALPNVASWLLRWPMPVGRDQTGGTEMFVELLCIGVTALIGIIQLFDVVH